MPICQFGGANCCAGPAEFVHEHEIAMHNKPRHYSIPPRSHMHIIISEDVTYHIKKRNLQPKI